MNTKEKTNIDRNTPRLIGTAFLVQAIASAFVGLVLLEPLKVPNDIAATMANYANDAMQVRVGIVVEMITVTALIVLSALLYLVLKNQNQKIALVALGLRLTEVALLAVSRIATFTFLGISQAFVNEDYPAYLETVGKLAFETQETAYSIGMIFFTLGGTLFYYLLYRSRYVPRALSIFGLIAAPLALIGELLTLLGVAVPLWVFIPNLPFELTIGLWLLIKRSSNPERTSAKTE